MDDDEDEDSSNDYEDAPLDGGDKTSTRSLHRLFLFTEPEFDQVSCLLDAKANPCWPRHQYSVDSAVLSAIDWNRLDLFKLMLVKWHNIDPPCPNQERECGFELVRYTASRGHPETMACLIDAGFRYKHVIPEIHKNVSRPFAEGLDEEEAQLSLSGRTLWRTLLERYHERETACRRAVICMMGPWLRMRMGWVPKDVMRLVAREIWRTNRHEEWESPCMSDRWRIRLEEDRRCEELYDARYLE